MGRLEVTTRIGCPVNCLDCPQSLLQSRYTGARELSFDNFKRAVDKVPPGTRIDFSGMCEPFANKHCTDMILYAAGKDLPLALYTTLQGATMDDLERLSGIDFEVATIHLPDCEGRSHFVIDDEYLHLLAKCDCTYYSCHGRVDERVRPYMKRRHIITKMIDRAGNLDCRPHTYIAPFRRLSCFSSGRELNHNVLLPNGDVVVCCMDYGLTAVFGNLFEEDYNAVMNSEAARDVRAKLDEGESICRHCNNAIVI